MRYIKGMVCLFEVAVTAQEKEKAACFKITQMLTLGRLDGCQNLLFQANVGGAAQSHSHAGSS